MNRRFLLTPIALACVSALADVKTTETIGGWDLYKGTAKVAAVPVAKTYADCLAAAKVAGATAGGVFTCRSIATIVVQVIAPAKPADVVQQVTCPSGSISGATWQQTRTWVAAPAPVYWSAQAWTPTAPQVGACPPAPPPPEMHGGVHVDTSKPFPAVMPGRGVELVRSPPGGNLQPGVNGTGDFRTVCGKSAISFDDPIVYPGQPGKAHLHVAFGNTLFNAFATYESLGTGFSTCRGGTVNQSLYWVPGFIDKTDSTYVEDSQAIIYYKNGNGDLHPETVQPIPAGLKMIAGNPLATDPVRFGIVGFSCNGFPFANDSDPWTGGPHVIPTDCPTLNDQWKTHEVWRIVSFPDCWDGVNLDSPDHKSHMSYWPSPNRNPDGSSREICPPSHPVKIAQLTIIVKTPIPAGRSPRNWVLSCDTGIPGSCMHGDYFERWQRKGGPDGKTDRMKQLTDGCNRAMLDCGASLLDRNTEILGFDDV